VDAATKPLKDATSSEGKEASAWYESVYGSGAAHRDKLLGETLPDGSPRTMRTRKKRETRTMRFRKKPTHGRSPAR